MVGPGVCATAIKKVCRKMGIKQWPHRKLKAVEKRLALLQVPSFLHLLYRLPASIPPSFSSFLHARSSLLLCFPSLFASLRRHRRSTST